MVNRYDDAIKALCAIDPTALCGWLGVPGSDDVRPLRLAESLPAPSTRAVDLLVAAGPHLAVHVEFQTRPEPRFARRMLGYWLRLDDLPELQGRTIEQHVVLLGAGHLADGIAVPGLAYAYHVHRLGDEDPERLLGDPTLAPFAALADVPDDRRPAVLARALELVSAVGDLGRRETLVRATVDLALVRLDAGTISATWKEFAMPVPSQLDRLYDHWRLEGREAGRAEGREAGLVQAAASLLRIRFGEDDRVDEVAERLAASGPAACMAAIEGAASFDELA